MATKDTSYANVVVTPQMNDTKKSQQQTDINDNNKENISTAPPTKEHSSDQTQSQAQEPEEIIDESEFTPVLSDKKKDRKSRQKRHDRNRSDAVKSSQDRSDKEKDRPDKPKRSRRERRAAKEATAPVAEQKSKDSKTAEKTDPDTTADSSDGQTEKPVKFVEAPLPKVNAWQVSFSILIFSY